MCVCVCVCVRACVRACVCVKYIVQCCCESLMDTGTEVHRVHVDW